MGSPHVWHGSLVALGAAALALAAFAGGERADAPKSARTTPLRYGRDIRPILSDKCFRCHGPDEASRQAKLRLDDRDAALASEAIVPGDARASELFARVTATDPDDVMPPPASHKKALTESELELLERWIDEGAVYEPHWAFVAPTRPPTPQVDDTAWVRNPVDAFVLEKLEREDVAPSPAAERATLLRRVFLDLTGLPPTPEELDEFLADTREDAYEHWVARLMTQEPYLTRYAERMATPWLDAARYADTNGIHMDAGRQIWPWRDWVLNAYRDNLPFDRFLTEQIAGDLLPDATQAQLIASGFNRNHVITDEGGAIDEEYRVEYAVDRAATTGQVFLGLTMGCARCHEHKYDPVSQDEFFRFYSYFNSNEEPGLYSQLPDANRAFEPFIKAPSEELKAEQARVEAELALAREDLERPSPDDELRFAEFLAELQREGGVEWVAPEPIFATAGNGVTLKIQDDGAVHAEGERPATEVHEITLVTQATGLRLLRLDVHTSPDRANPRVGRADNGNAVLSGVKVVARSHANQEREHEVRLKWAWADYEQQNGDFGVVNVLDLDSLGWAVDAHNRTGPRVALLLADEPFGFEGGTSLIVQLQYNSVYAQHAFGWVSLDAARVTDALLERLPLASSAWRICGPFPAARGEVFEKRFGPEDSPLDFAQKFGELAWRTEIGFKDGVTNATPDGTAASYVAKRIFSPTARTLEVSLGSDDGFRLFVNGVEAAKNQIDRAVGVDQDKGTIALNAGANDLVFKIVNTGGQGGFYFKALEGAERFTRELCAALVPADRRWSELDARLKNAWRLDASPEYRAKAERVAGLDKQIAEIDARTPRTMVMREMAKPRETYVLMRGQYDKPDTSRPAPRGVPAALGALPEGAPANRLGLAQWMTAPHNPLVARVAVNRLWEMVFGTGLVTTSDDFGLRSEWPSHPELLDWLATEFRESGWNVQHVLTLMVTSNTYRQSSRARPELRDRDPHNRWLAFSPRRRLGAEEIRDSALYIAGLLVERFGGPSAKPYQPEGLWQEVAMLQSNTRVYERDNGDGLWRRSLYTYWKRACPPPALLMLDAPTREFCTIKRNATNTPLQAFVLWNDEQFVEAARVLAQRTLGDANAASDDAKLGNMFRRCTSRVPAAEELDALRQTLAAFRERYSNDAEGAASLVELGEAMTATDLDARELAAWTMIANALLNLDATISRS
jgi:hypothetical protein